MPQRLFIALAKLGIIIAGVLIALTADAWWEDQQDRAEEVLIVADLLEEFRTNEERLERDISANQSKSCGSA